MTLYYKATTTVTTTERKELCVPTQWCMFSAAGNSRITKLAREAMGKLEELREGGDATSQEINNVLLAFVTKWARLAYTKAYGEAGDTEVRGQVGEFHDRLALAVGAATEYNVRSLWERNHCDALRRVSQERGKKTSA